jgi:hypothetical protein
MVLVRIFLLGLLTLLLSVVAFAAASDGAREDTLALNSGERLYRINDRVDYYFSPHKAPNVLTAIPLDVGTYFSQTFRDKNVPAICNMAIATAILVGYDQEITDASKHISRHWGLKPTNHQTAIVSERVKIGSKSYPLNIQVPSDLSSGLYFIGDGITHFGTAAAFGVYGLAANDYRAKQTCVQCVEAIFATGAVVQVIKHVTGREAPTAASARGGVWQPFPNQVKYGDHVAKYDAFPTRHLATAMATVTVIADNYPEHKYIKPLGYTLIGICGFSMLNNGVHWASDYPLGIAMGYSFGKIVTARSRVVIKEPAAKNGKERLSLWQRTSFSPALLNGRTAGWGVQLQLDRP